MLAKSELDGPALPPGPGAAGAAAVTPPPPVPAADRKRSHMIFDFACVFSLLFLVRVLTIYGPRAEARPAEQMKGAGLFLPSRGFFFVFNFIFIY